MLISKAMNAALNVQIGNELAASNQYVAIAGYFDGEGLPVLAKHFFKQAAEERDHALRFVRIVLDGSGDLKIPQVPAPKPSFKNSADAVQLALDSDKLSEVLRDVVDEAVLAESVGLDCFGVGEHHRKDFAISAPEVILAAIAGRTSRMWLGSAVTVLSTDDPVRVFQRFDAIDLVG